MVSILEEIKLSLGLYAFVKQKLEKLTLIMEV